MCQKEIINFLITKKEKNINIEKVAIVEKYDTNMFHSLKRKLDTV